MAPRNRGSKAKGKGKAPAIDKSETTASYANGAAQITLTFANGN